MDGRPKITKIEIREFEYAMANMGPDTVSAHPHYKKGSSLKVRTFALKIMTDIGVAGEYVGGIAADYAAFPMFVHSVIGRNALDREAIYTAAKHGVRHYALIGMSQFDIALWDLAGKFFNAPVYELLGAYRTSIPGCASTNAGDDEPDGLSTPEAYADFAQACLERGFRAFKMHPPIKRSVEWHVATIHAVGKRVGGKMDLMIDPFHALDTFGDALKVGWACDEEKFLWWEDPYKDGGISAFGHRKLRQLVRTPLLQTEHSRGVEPHVDYILADGTDFVRTDPDYDGGITGSMKVAHAAEGFGLDCEIHLSGPARRHLMAAIRNSNYYEMGLFHPKAAAAFQPPVYLDGYSDEFDAIDKDGCVQAPQKPGLGVAIDWDYITRHTTATATYP